MAALLADVRYACRALAKAPGFTAAALFTLGLGMVFFLTASAVARAYLLRDLPYPAAERLYWVRYAEPGGPQPRDMERVDWRQLDDVVEYPVAWDLDAFFVLGGETAEATAGAWVTRDFLDALGVRPALGRSLDAASFAPGGQNEALISHRLWQARFGGAADVVGRQFDAYVSDRSGETERFTVVGVLPPTFWHLNPYTEILAPLRAPTYPYIVRLRQGVTPEVVQRRITSIVTSGAREVPAGFGVRLESVHASYVERVRPILRAVMIAAVLVLLVACANVAGLLLVRAERRRSEIAIRASLGAGRLAIARLLSVEAALVGAGATGLAILAASFGLDALEPLVEQQIGRRLPGGAGALALDRTMVFYATAAGLATAVSCSIAPLLAVVRREGWTLAPGRSRTATPGTGSTRFRSSLIAAEIAVSLALLSGAALMLRSAQALTAVDLGIDTDGVLTGAVTLRESRYPAPAARTAALDAVLGRLAALPRVDAAAMTSMWPLQEPRPRPLRTGDGETRIPVQAVSDRYFDTLRIPMRAGRAFQSADRDGAEPVLVVSETLARRLWPDVSPIGARVAVPPPDEGEPRLHVVVGVVADVRQGALDDNLADAYVPLAQQPGRSVFALVRTRDAAAEALPLLRTAVREVDPEIAVDRAVPMQAVADQTTAGTQTLARVLGIFALAAVALALIGIHGAVSYAVRQREREIAVRVAIGADPAQIVGLFVREAAVVVGIGIVLGVAAAIAGTRAIESQLFGVRPGDPLALGAAAVAFGCAALAASCWPARRAASTDPAIALRVE